METRREALSSFKSLNHRVPHLFNPIIREALVTYILQKEVHLPSTSAETSQPSPVVEGLAGVVLAIASFDEATDITVREELMAGLIILTHHPAVGMCAVELFYCRKLIIS
jgi:Generalcontrol nonderepressible 1 (Gcn1) N-terminal